MVSAKNNKGTVYRLSKAIVGKQLIEVFKMLKNAGLAINVVSLDGTNLSSPAERDPSRINVHVYDSRISKSWIG